MQWVIRTMVSARVLRSPIYFHHSTDGAFSDTNTSHPYPDRHAYPAAARTRRLVHHRAVSSIPSLGLLLMLFSVALILLRYATGLPRLVSYTLLIANCSRMMWSKSIGRDLEVFRKAVAFSAIYKQPFLSRNPKHDIFESTLHRTQHSSLSSLQSLFYLGSSST